MWCFIYLTEIFMFYNLFYFKGTVKVESSEYPNEPTSGIPSLPGVGLNGAAAAYYSGPPVPVPSVQPAHNSAQQAGPSCSEIGKFENQ